MQYPVLQLWHAYLKERRAAIRGLALNHAAVEGLNNTYERALVSMHKMPRVWVEYLELLVSQQKLTHTRHVFDRCLCSLPITQHDRVWTLYLVSAVQQGIMYLLYTVCISPDAYLVPLLSVLLQSGCMEAVSRRCINPTGFCMAQEQVYCWMK